MGTIRGLLTYPNVIAVADADGYDRIFRPLPKGKIRHITIVNVTRAFLANCELYGPGGAESKESGYARILQNEPGDANENVIWHGELPIGDGWSIEATIQCQNGDRLDFTILVEQP